MVLSLSRTVFFRLACPGMMNVLAMYLRQSKRFYTGERYTIIATPTSQ